MGGMIDKRRHRFNRTVSDLGYGTNHYLRHWVGTLGCTFGLCADAGGAERSSSRYDVPRRD